MWQPELCNVSAGGAYQTHLVLYCLQYWACITSIRRTLSDLFRAVILCRLLARWPSRDSMSTLNGALKRR